MFDAIERSTRLHGQTADPDAIAELAEGDFPSELHDRQISNVPREGERRTFELPAFVWKVMVGNYAVFLAVLFGSLGGARANFAIAVSAIYVIIFFGVASLIARQGTPQPRSVLEHPDAVLQTIYGPMSRGAVFSQILVVPLAVTLFGVLFAIIHVLLA